MKAGPLLADLTEHPLDQNTSEATRRDLAVLIVSTLSLDIEPGTIDPATPLFGEGLGLDSIDALEIALAISKHYGFELRSDDERNKSIFSTLDSLAEHIAANRTQ